MLVTAGPAELIRMNATGQESWCRVLEPSALPGTNPLLAGFEGGARGPEEGGLGRGGVGETQGNDYLPTSAEVC